MRNENSPALCLVVRAGMDGILFDPAWRQAFAECAVAAVILHDMPRSDPAYATVLKERIGSIQAGGTAVLIADDIALAKDLSADGVHLTMSAPSTSGEDRKNNAVHRARQMLGADHIVGAGALNSRHDAMQAGDWGADYVFFGRLDHVRGDVHPKALSLAQWWAALFEIPAVLMCGSRAAALAEALQTPVEFIAHDGAWIMAPDYPDSYPDNIVARPSEPL